MKIQKKLEENPPFWSVFVRSFGELSRILSRYFWAFWDFFHLLDRNAASQWLWLTRGVICLYSTWLWKEKKSLNHICNTFYAFQEERNMLARLSIYRISSRHIVAYLIRTKINYFRFLCATFPQSAYKIVPKSKVCCICDEFDVKNARHLYKGSPVIFCRWVYIGLAYWHQH